MFIHYCLTFHFLSILIFISFDYIISQAADRIDILLREQNVKTLSHLTSARQKTQADMFKFTDKLFKALANQCVCCRIRGFTDCPLRSRNTTPGHTIYITSCSWKSLTLFLSHVEFFHIFCLSLTLDAPF
jgi:hypothetical protein